MFSPEQMRAMSSMMNEDMIKQSANMISQMSDSQLQSCMEMSGMPQVDPSLLKNTASAMSSAPSELSPGLKRAEKIKNEGNNFFKAGDYQSASEKYNESLDLLGQEGLSPEIKPIEVSCRLNLAACLSKQGKDQEVIDQCKKVKSRQALVYGKNAKAFYRYAGALYKQEKLEEAFDKIQEAWKLSPNDPNSTFYIVISLKAEIEAVAPERPEQENRAQTTSQTKTQKASQNNTQTKHQEKKSKMHIVEVEEETKDTSTPHVPNIEPLGTRGRPAGFPNISEDQYKQGLQTLQNMDPETIKRMCHTAKTMNPDLLKSTFRNQGLDVTPEQIDKMSEMLTPENIEHMSKMLNNQEGPTSLPDLKNMDSQQFSNLLNNPAMTEMMGNMLATQFGRSPQEMEMALGCLRKVLAVFVGVRKVYNFFTQGTRKYVTSALVVFYIAYLLGFA